MRESETTVRRRENAVQAREASIQQRETDVTTQENLLTERNTAQHENQIRLEAEFQQQLRTITEREQRVQSMEKSVTDRQDDIADGLVAIQKLRDRQRTKRLALENRERALITQRENEQRQLQESRHLAEQREEELSEMKRCLDKMQQRLELEKLSKEAEFRAREGLIAEGEQRLEQLIREVEERADSFRIEETRWRDERDEEMARAIQDNLDREQEAERWQAIREEEHRRRPKRSVVGIFGRRRNG